MKMTVSAIIPVFNGARFLTDALASIRAQDVLPDEIIVVDDGSSDGSAELARGLGTEIQVLAHPANLGLSSARNTGVEAAQGELISFLDVDDLWLPGKTNIQLDLMNRDSDVDVVIGRTQKLRLVREVDGQREFERWSEPEPALSLGASLIRRRAFDLIGKFDTSLAFTLDWDWFMRGREQGVVIRMHSDVVQFYRRHGSNMSEDVDEGNKDTLRMLKMSLARRRQDPSTELDSLPGLQQD